MKHKQANYSAYFCTVEGTHRYVKKRAVFFPPCAVTAKQERPAAVENYPGGITINNYKLLGVIDGVV